VTGRCEKIDLQMWSEFGLKKDAPGCPISGRWSVGTFRIKPETVKFQPNQFFHIFQTGRNRIISYAGNCLERLRARYISSATSPVCPFLSRR
jgi:hypothetical protein